MVHMAPELQPVGKTLIVFWLIITGLGLVLLMAPKIPWLGRLPGDIFIQRDRMTLYIPLASCLLASLLLSFLFWLWSRFHR